VQETSYKGYRIRYHKVADWFAQVYPPGSGLALGGDIPKATLQEGEHIMLMRAKAKVDAHIEAGKNAAEKKVSDEKK
jgi:hypothetical protein